MNLLKDMVKYAKFEAYGIEVNPSKTNSQRIEVAVVVDINELLNAIEMDAIISYLEDRGFKVEKL